MTQGLQTETGELHFDIRKIYSPSTGCGVFVLEVSLNLVLALL